MNEVVKELLSHNYLDKGMKKQVFICKRSRKKRIQNKAFTKLFYAYMQEKPVSVIGKVVLVKNDLHLELMSFVDKKVELGKLD